MSAPPSPQRACAGTCPAMVAAVPLGQGRSSQAALLPNTGEMCTCSMPSCDLERSEVQNLPGLGVSDKGLRTSVNCTGAATLEGFTTASNIQGKVLLLTICAAGIGGTFQFGYNLSIINAPTLHIQDFTNETWWARTGRPLPDHLVLLVWSLIVSLYPLGGLFGALLAGPLAIKLGRKKSLLVNNVFVVAAAILFGFSRRAGSFEMIMLGRLLVGVSAGSSWAARRPGPCCWPAAWCPGCSSWPPCPCFPRARATSSLTVETPRPAWQRCSDCGAPRTWRASWRSWSRSAPPAGTGARGARGSCSGSAPCGGRWRAWWCWAAPWSSAGTTRCTPTPPACSGRRGSPRRRSSTPSSGPGAASCSPPLSAVWSLRGWAGVCC
uniref:Solute carrier family 2 member 11 n=1 Tax=Equus asinus TaxID=9793 RepID=A0A8C4KTE4_EQUAS